MYRSTQSWCSLCRVSTMASAAAKYSNLSGVLFRQFKRRKDLIKSHWLDKNTNKYYDVMKQVAIPECMNIAPEVPGYPQRIKEMLSYNCPAFSDAWSFKVELLYRMVADKSHQTEENITKMYLLRAITDMSYTSLSLLDDYSDNAEYRLGKRTWYTFCEGGMAAGVCDSTQIGVCSFHLLKKYFENDPGYTHMIELIASGFLTITIGQTLDIHGQGKSIPSMNHYKPTVYYKAGQTYKTGSALALLHAGILSEEIIDKTMEVFSIAGQLVQIWDDFNDYYSAPEQTGKPPLDFINGATTWASVTAMENFSPSQAVEFKECYGSPDLVKIKRACQLYDEIDLPSIYVHYMIGNYNTCKRLIGSIPHQGVQEACSSYVEWLVGQNSNNKNLS